MCSNKNSTYNTFHGLLNNVFYLYSPARHNKPRCSFSLPSNVVTLNCCKYSAWRRLKSQCNTITMTAFKHITNMSRKAIRAFVSQFRTLNTL